MYINLGTRHGGHYQCFILQRSDSSSDFYWLLCDDENVPEIVQDYPLEGYFLVYESKASVDFSQWKTSQPGTIPNSFQEKIPDTMQ